MEQWYFLTCEINECKYALDSKNESVRYLDYYMDSIVHVSCRFFGLCGTEINLAGIFYNLFVWLYLGCINRYKYTNILVQKIKLDQIIGNLDFFAVKARSIWQPKLIENVNLLLVSLSTLSVDNDTCNKTMFYQLEKREQGSQS